METTTRGAETMRGVTARRRRTPALRDRGHTDHDHGQNRFAAIPTPVRLDADPEATGRGITIAVIDAGFRRHPDLERPESRVLASKDISRPRAQETRRGEIQAWEWHGTQTAVVAAGNGRLSDGTYRSLAPDAHVVLVQVGREGRVDDEAVAAGLRWVIRNRRRFGIRVATLSIGGDRDGSEGPSPADLAAEAAVAAGIVVVVAAGNAGDSERHHVVAPATAPSVITVGGLDDRNELDAAGPGLYRSSFGAAAGGPAKPELVAPATFVAAPILDGTPLAREAIALTRLAAAPDYLLPRLHRALAADAGLPALSGSPGPAAIRAAVEDRIRERRIASAHYQHVEGTSFAAPIVASVAAQMIEVAPGLDPAAVKRILVASADRVPGAPGHRQGAGALNAGRAVAWARLGGVPPAIEITRSRTPVTYRDHDARSVALAGAFNDWSATATPMGRVAPDLWRAEIDPLPAGRHPYKLVVDGTRWVTDPDNPVDEPDGHGGRNSVLVVGEESRS